MPKSYFGVTELSRSTAITDLIVTRAVSAIAKLVFLFEYSMQETDFQFCTAHRMTNFFVVSLKSTFYRRYRHVTTVEIK